MLQQTLQGVALAGAGAALLLVGAPAPDRRAAAGTLAAVVYCTSSASPPVAGDAAEARRGAAGAAPGHGAARRRRSEPANSAARGRERRAAAAGPRRCCARGRDLASRERLASGFLRLMMPLHPSRARRLLLARPAEAAAIAGACGWHAGACSRRRGRQLRKGDCQPLGKLFAGGYALWRRRRRRRVRWLLRPRRLGRPGGRSCRRGRGCGRASQRTWGQGPDRHTPCKLLLPRRRGGRRRGHSRGRRCGGARSCRCGRRACQAVGAGPGLARLRGFV